MHTLTIIGLGPGSREYLTLGAFEKMKQTNKVYLRTNKHPVVSFLESEGICYESFDFFYEKEENFYKVYESVVNSLVDMVQSENIIYAVPGSPFVAENTVQMLMKEAQKNKFLLDFIPSVSFIEALLHTLRKDPITGLKIIDGLGFDEQIDIQTDTIITQVYNQFVASQIKLKLMEYYPDEHPIIVVHAAGIPNEEKIQNIMLYELDRIPWLDYLTSVYIPKIEGRIRKKYELKDLMKIMGRLRGEDGCPWDKEQTHESLKPHLIEEAYEVLEALDQEDMVLLEEELGDLLLQVAFHALLASEKEEFDMDDVIKGICTKLIYRHPHVFKDVVAESKDDAIKSWEDMKRKEKNIKTYTQGLRRIPNHLPSLIKSYKVQGKAKEVGFDWDRVEDALKKVEEEYKELLEVYNTGENEKIKEEVGDLLFAVVNVARFLEINPEIALNNTVEKFISRFSFIEENAIKNDRKLEEMSLEEMDELWNLAKIHKKR
ncbi:nucleoside triphosphate pyrophosphohydrolase [Anaerophilus nitritogenes]|uniref:nucleoside triphosphate pyrophosphohydrolase n=1 Tax=Anaerophilus nitritogenes TaxID=2498136 RepID=UPI00101D53F7|nr:nucleoside triphosphate pyrophosphohydrolase [Anaerophilus nitritogenes]